MGALTSLALRFAAPLPDVESFRRFLFIGPHPDDIEIGAGATAAKLAADGKQLAFLICTDGRYGAGNAPEGISPDELAGLRKREAAASAAMLGVQDVRFLDLSDGGFYSYTELVRGIAQAVGQFQPELIFAPDPFVSSECHDDHLRVGRAAQKIACFAPYAGIMEQFGAAAAPVRAIAFYMTAKPNRFVKTGAYFARQQEAVFRCHTTQFPPNTPDAKALRAYLKLRSADYGLRCLCRSAEGFRVLGSTHMHCLPEAGK